MKFAWIGFMIFLLFLAVPTHAQIMCMDLDEDMWSCSDGTTGMNYGNGMSGWTTPRGGSGSSFDLGNGMGSFQYQEHGRSHTGTYQQFGNQGFWQDDHGNTGTWMDLGNGMRTYQTQPSQRHRR